jgi:hypothetical protein
MRQERENEMRKKSTEKRERLNDEWRQKIKLPCDEKSKHIHTRVRSNGGKKDLKNEIFSIFVAVN